MPVNVIGTLKPKNNGKFPVAEAVDIKVTDDLRLDEALENKADLSTVNFALDNKADKTTTTNLQSQIDEIITPVTQDAEVQNARVGADGKSYNTLKARLDTDSNRVTELAESINPINVLTFEQGTIYNGKDDISDKRIRTGYSPIKGKISCELKPSYSALLNYYTADFTYISVMDWQDVSFVATPPTNAAYYRVVCRHANNSEIIPSESSNITIRDVRNNIASSLDNISVIEQVSTENKNEISELKNKFPDLTYLKSLDLYNNTELDVTSFGWRNAIPHPDTGVIVASTTRICTQKIGIPYLSNGLKITLSEGYKVGFYFYDSDDNFIRNDFWYEQESNIITFNKNETKLIIAIAHSDDSIIGTSDFSAIESIESAATLEMFPLNDPDLFGFVLGTLIPDTGKEGTNNKRIRSNYLFLGKGTLIKFSGKSNSLVVYEFEKDKKTLRSASDWSEGNLYTITDDCYCRILLRNNNAVISDDDISVLTSQLVIYPVQPFSTYDSILEAKVDIPSYYGDLSTEVASVNENAMAAGKNGTTFAFCTDIHWENNSKIIPAILQKLKEKSIRTDYLIIGGDLINGGTKSTEISYMQECADSIYKAGYRSFFVNGNHDNNSVPAGNELITYDEFFSIAQSQMPYGTVFKDYCYFYYDDFLTNTRFVFLDSGFTDNTALSDQQSQFIDDTLESTPSGWHIVFFWHIVYSIASGTTWETVPLQLNPTSFSQAVFSKLDSHNASSDSKVEAIIGGHVHSDWNFETTGGIPIVLTDTASLYPLSGGTATRGEISETACDIITINYSYQNIKCVRIGRGSDRTINY